MAVTPQELRVLLRSSWYGTIDHMTRRDLLTYRRIRVNCIDGDDMPHLCLWPTYIRRIFFKQQPPLSDREAFTLFLFFLGNGYSAFRAGTWILSSHAFMPWNRRHALVNKRIQQLCWIYRNVRENSFIWYYHDIDAGHNVSFNDYINFTRN